MSSAASQRRKQAGEGAEDAQHDVILRAMDPEGSGEVAVQRYNQGKLRD